MIQKTEKLNPNRKNLDQERKREACNLSNLWMRFTLLFQEVLHSLDIVVGYFLDLLDFQRVVHAEPIDDPLQVSLSFFAKAGDFGDFGNVRKLKKPFDLTNTRTWVH